MKNNFWEKLKKPFFCLAPMEDVTDPAFRRLFAKYGKPDVMWTEFTSADALISDGRKRVEKDLAYTEKERPIVAQLFSACPERMEKAAAIAQELGFDGLDINMGCPDKAIEKQGAGCALIKDPRLAQDIIRAAQNGAPRVPVSVKTRIGYRKNELAKWLPALLETNINAVTMHLRARAEMSKVPAHWELAGEMIEIRNNCQSKTLLIGNGDVSTLADAKQKAKETGLDGIMIGRGIFGNPWFFSGKTPSREDRLSVLVEHAKLYEKLLPQRPFAIMKKHIKAYVSGWDGAKELRIKLMECENADEIKTVILSGTKTAKQSSEVEGFH